MDMRIPALVVEILVESKPSETQNLSTEIGRLHWLLDGVGKRVSQIAHMLSCVVLSARALPEIPCMLPHVPTFPHESLLLPVEVRCYVSCFKCLAQNA